MQEKDHWVKLASDVVHWDVYLIAIANATQRDIAVQKASFDSWGCGGSKGSRNQKGTQSQCPYPHDSALNHDDLRFHYLHAKTKLVLLAPGSFTELS
jgi:hypothetical protein